MPDQLSDEALASHYHAMPTTLLVRSLRYHAGERATAERLGVDPLAFHVRRIALIARELEARGEVVDVEGGLFPR